MSVWENKKIKYATTSSSFYHSFTPTLTHPVFVVHNIAQHVVLVQYASISMFQPVDLDPIAGVLNKNKERVLAM